MRLPTPQQPRVWITSFWGFSPQDEGYLGFTKEGNRKWFIDRWQPGDLVLIYGTNTGLTATEQRNQALGFLEIEPMPILDTDRMSGAAKARKVENGWSDRWTNALPVVRAAKVMRPIGIHHIATQTISRQHARNIAARGELLLPKEAALALQLPIRPLNVYGLPPLAEELLAQEFFPSKGIDPKFGQSITNRTDGEHYVYVMRLEGEVARLLGRENYEVGEKAIFKIGYSNDPSRRESEVNSGLPPAMHMRWKTVWQSRSFATGQEAKDAEDRLKLELKDSADSLGGEFYLCAEGALQTAFAIATAETAVFKLKV